MTTLMRIGRDRRSGKPVMCHARKERVLLFGTRSADYIRASGQSGRIQRPNTWLHPNASLKGQIFPLHRGRRPYMAHRVIRGIATFCPLLDQSGQRLVLARDGLSANDPNVWSGRALQVDFAELAVSGLASMYPASDWSVLCSGPSWISARVRSH